MAVGLGVREVGQVTVLRPSGRIDSQSSPAFELAVSDLLGRTQRIVLDFADVPYISSAGLRVVLLVAKRIGRAQGGQFALASLRPELLDVFKISGLTSVLKIFETPESALAALAAA